MKDEFLKKILLWSEQGKTIPLSTPVRVKMVKALLHKNTKTFDFATLGSPFKTRNLSLVKEWDAIYDDMWSHLSESSPNLIMIKETRPIQESTSENENVIYWLHQSVFNPLSCKFAKLLCLETNCHIKSGMFYSLINLTKILISSWVNKCNNFVISLK